MGHAFSACVNGQLDTKRTKTTPTQGADVTKSEGNAPSLAPTPLDKITVDDNGTTQLLAACASVLLAACASVPLTPGVVRTITQLLRDVQTDVDEADATGWTPLHEACAAGSAEVVRLLVEFRADVNKADNEGYTPLHEACDGGHYSVVSILLVCGADVDKAANDGVTPLHVASCNGHVEVVRLLLENSANVHSGNSNGETPLYGACFEGHVHAVQLLLDNGADVNKGGESGFTPLHFACAKDNLDMARVLLLNGAKVDKASDNGWTPSEFATSEGHARLATWLGACTGWTRLHFACEARREDVVRDMLRDDSLSASTTRAALLGPAGEGRWTALQIAQSESTIDHDAFEVSNQGAQSSAYVHSVSESLVRMLYLAAQPWRPANHDLFPRSFRAGVFFMMLVDHRLGSISRGAELRGSPRHRCRIMSLPTDVWLHALSFASWDWFISIPQSFLSIVGVTVEKHAKE